MIHVEQLTKNFGEIAAVRGMTFTVAQGDVVGLLGPNGAGKTTTMKILTTFLAPSGGTATVAGFDVTRNAQDVRRLIGYLPEHPPLYPELRVSEYLNFIAKIKGIASRDIKKRVADVIEQCALSSVYTRICSQLSRGFRQRVGLAQAIIHQPKVIILDEPTSGLDPAQIIDIRRTIANLKGNHTVILSTHILPEVVQTCNKVIIVARGEVVIEGPLDVLTAQHTLEERFLEAVSS